MEEKYKLTKEERESIKNIFKVAKRAKMRVRTSINEHDLLGIMREEKSKMESKKDINIGLTLESDLKYCNQITPALETIAYSPTTEGTKESYFAEKLIPYVKKYKDMLTKAIKLNKEDEEYVQQLRKWEKTGKPEDFPYRKGRTRSEELKKQDIENREIMKRFHKAEDKTGLELPLAEGLYDMTHKKPKKQSQYPRYTERMFLGDIGDDKSFEECVDPLGPFCIRVTAKSFMQYFDNQLKKMGIEEKFLVPELTRCSVEDSKVFHRYCTQKLYKKKV